jgi:hypothetical protein
MSILTNHKEKSPSEIYGYCKSRMDVETAFDAFKNTLEADCTAKRPILRGLDVYKLPRPASLLANLKAFGQK